PESPAAPNCFGAELRTDLIDRLLDGAPLRGRGKKIWHIRLPRLDELGDADPDEPEPRGADGVLEQRARDVPNLLRELRRLGQRVAARDATKIRTAQLEHHDAARELRALQPARDGLAERP